MSEEIELLPSKEKICDIGNYLVINTIEEAFDIIDDIYKNASMPETEKQKNRLMVLSELSNAIQLRNFVCKKNNY